MGSIIIAGGGTGGHIYPGISIAMELKKYDYKVCFVVKKNDKGIRILQEHGLSYEEVPAMGFPRRSFLKLFSFSISLVRGFISSAMFIKKTRPSAVVGLGGYTSFNVVLAAKLFGIPSIIHEQNYIPGLANRALSIFADKVAVSFEESLRYFGKKKTILTGNPVRTEVLNAKKDFNKLNLDENRFTVFVFGGSQGASAINLCVAASLEYLEEYRENMQFIHITGENDFEKVKKTYSERKFKASVLRYFSRIEYAYAVADLIICRSGATTVAELRYIDAPAILIPYPHATDNHQYYNAKAYLSSGGLGEIIVEKDLTPSSIAQKISNHIDNPHRKSLKAPTKLPQKKIFEEIVKLMSG